MVGCCSCAGLAEQGVVVVVVVVKERARGREQGRKRSEKSAGRRTEASPSVAKIGFLCEVGEAEA